MRKLGYQSYLYTETITWLRAVVTAFNILQANCYTRPQNDSFVILPPETTDLYFCPVTCTVTVTSVEKSIKNEEAVSRLQRSEC